MNCLVPFSHWFHGSLDARRLEKEVRNEWWLWRLIAETRGANIEQFFGEFADGIPLDVVIKANLALNELFEREAKAQEDAIARAKKTKNV